VDVQPDQVQPGRAATGREAGDPAAAVAHVKAGRTRRLVHWVTAFGSGMTLALVLTGAVVACDRGVLTCGPASLTSPASRQTTLTVGPCLYDPHDVRVSWTSQFHLGTTTVTGPAGSDWAGGPLIDAVSVPLPQDGRWTLVLQEAAVDRHNTAKCYDGLLTLQVAVGVATPTSPPPTAAPTPTPAPTPAPTPTPVPSVAAMPSSSPAAPPEASAASGPADAAPGAAPGQTQWAQAPTFGDRTADPGGGQIALVVAASPAAGPGNSPAAAPEPEGPGPEGGSGTGGVWAIAAAAALAFGVLAIGRHRSHRRAR